MNGRRVHFIGIAGTAMATLAAMLKARGYDVQGSDHGVYPPMSDFLAREGIRVLDGYRAEHITAEIDSSSSATRSRAAIPSSRKCSIARSGIASLPEAIRDAVPLERALDRDRRHARQDDDDGADRLAADGGRAAIRACSSAASRPTSTAATGSAPGATS